MVHKHLPVLYVRKLLTLRVDAGTQRGGAARRSVCGAVERTELGANAQADAELSVMHSRTFKAAGSAQLEHQKQRWQHGTQYEAGWRTLLQRSQSSPCLFREIVFFPVKGCDNVSHFCKRRRSTLKHWPHGWRTAHNAMRALVTKASSGCTRLLRPHNAIDDQCTRVSVAAEEEDSSVQPKYKQLVTQHM